MSISTLRPISIQIENISGMTSTIAFDSELVIIYGYNREGKTIFIKCFDYVFNGFRPKNRVNLKHILVDATNGKIVLIFTFKGILYRLIREITKKKEYVIFQRSLKSFQEYKDLPNAKKKLIFDGSNGIDIISRMEVLSKGGSIETLPEELKKIKLHPEIIDRLIAIENIQEFKNATEKFATSGGGYDSIKDILHKDLKDKGEAIKSIKDYTSKTIGKLESQTRTIQNAHTALIDNLKAVTTCKDGTIEYEELIGTLQLNNSHDDVLNSVKSKLKKDQEEYQKYWQTTEKLKTDIPSKKEKYKELEYLLKSMNLRGVEVVVEVYYKDVTDIQDLYSKLSQIHREIESNPPAVELEEISIDFSTKFNDTLNELVEGFELYSVQNIEEMLAIPDNINGYIRKFNEGIKLYSKRKKVLTRFNIEENDILTAIQSRTSQLSNIKNPIFFTKQDEIFPLYGKVGEDLLGNKKLKVFMSLTDLVDYDNKNYPLTVDQNLLPVLTEKDDKGMTDNIVKKLSRKIEQDIAELEDLSESIKEINELEPILLQDLKNFDEDLKVLLKTKEIVDSWNELISEQKTISHKFINKYSNKKTKASTFEHISKLLENIEKQFKQELKDEGFKINFNVDDTKNLSDLIADYEIIIEKEIVSIEEFLEIVRNFNEFLSDNQETYKQLCKNIELNKSLKNIIIPSIQVICAQIESNIQLDVIEEQVMTKIIKYAEHFYKEICKEGYLKFDKQTDRNGKIYLKPKIMSQEGKTIEIADNMPSGSEQGSIALGIMVALAKLFNGFIVIDEVTDRFDYDSKQRFFDAIKNFSENLFWIIVLKVDSRKEKIPEEFQEIRDTFSEALILQPVRRNLKIRVKELNRFEDFTIKEG